MNGNASIEEYHDSKEEEFKFFDEPEEEEKKDNLLDTTEDEEGKEGEDEEVQEQEFEERGINFPRPVSVVVGSGAVDKSEHLEFDLDRLKSGTNYMKYTNQAYLDKVHSIIPIENRIYKAKNTSIDIWVTDTLITAQRKLNNDGKSKKSTLSRSNSMSFDELVKVNAHIEVLKDKNKGKTPVDIPITLYSSKALESLNPDVLGVTE